MVPLLCLVLGAGSIAAGDGICTDVSYLYQPAFSMDHELREPAVPYVPQPGDILLCTGREMWAKVGHWAAGTGAPQHSGIVFLRPDGRPALLEGGPNNSLHCHALDIIPELQGYADHERVWIRRRCVPLTDEQSAALTAFALSVEGKRFALVRMLAQITPFRSRGTWQTEFVGGPHGDRVSYFCSELVTEACVAAGLLDPGTTRPAAMYPRDLFFGRSNNAFIDKHLDMSAWEPPARWTLAPGTEPKTIRHFPRLDGDTPIAAESAPGEVSP
jgi:hypothetical protein